MSRLKKFFLFLLPLIFITPFLFKGKDSPQISVDFFKEKFFREPVLKSNLNSDTSDLVLVQKNSIYSFPSAFIPPKTSATLIKSEEKEIVEYEVKEGDSLWSIAQNFGISIETIIWANNLENLLIKPGQKLLILPVSGVMHFVKEGDTISKIAQMYQAKVEDIISFNELQSPDDIYIGDILIVPGGKMPSPSSVSLPSLIPLPGSYFICPVSGGCKITQGLHWYNAVDFGGKCGQPILAAAGGIVQKVRYGWNGGAGNFIKIEHPNGIITFYAHLQAIMVSPGDKVSPGDIVGIMGTTGKSTGCHLHFGVYGARNPFAK